MFRLFYIIGDCGASNENGLSRLIYFNTWTPVGRTLWELLWVVAILEEMS